MTIFFKLPPNSGHLSITDNLPKTHRCQLFRGFTVLALKLDSHLPKKIALFTSMKALKNNEKCFLFHLKSSFCSQDI